jgi:hypothetical protein
VGEVFWTELWGYTSLGAWIWFILLINLSLDELVEEDIFTMFCIFYVTFVQEAVNTSTEQGWKDKLMLANRNICSAFLLESYKNTQLGVCFTCAFSGIWRDITVLILSGCGKDIQKLLYFCCRYLVLWIHNLLMCQIFVNCVIFYLLCVDVIKILCNYWKQIKFLVLGGKSVLSWMVFEWLFSKAV